MHLPHAVIFIPAALHLVEHFNACRLHCEAHGYQIAGLVTTTWDDALTMIWARAAGVVVVARREHLPPDREPRVEVAAEAETPSGHCRTRIIRRDAAT